MMTLTQAAKQRACDLANAATPGRYFWSVDDLVPERSPPGKGALIALAHHIQAVSDAVKAYNEWRGPLVYSEPRADLARFVLPAEPDVLEQAMEQAGFKLTADAMGRFRQALATLGHEVKPIGGE